MFEDQSAFEIRNSVKVPGLGQQLTGGPTKQKATGDASAIIESPGRFFPVLFEISLTMADRRLQAAVDPIQTRSASEERTGEVWAFSFNGEPQA
jgi:hypothetical protein